MEDALYAPRSVGHTAARTIAQRYVYHAKKEQPFSCWKTAAQPIIGLNMLLAYLEIPLLPAKAFGTFWLR